MKSHARSPRLGVRKGSTMTSGRMGLHNTWAYIHSGPSAFATCFSSQQISLPALKMAAARFQTLSNSAISASEKSRIAGNALSSPPDNKNPELSMKT